MRRFLITVVALAAALGVSTSAVGHELDHPAPALSGSAPLSSEFNSGGEGAEWDLITTIVTGNPHSDLDVFTQGADTFASVGTLGTSANGGGQTIVKLMEGDEVDPSFVSSHPSASCVSDPANATGLQHDVEATPKGNAILNTANPHAVRSDTQLLIDATDNEGRCHDNGQLGFGAPKGGLEIIDVTDPANPVEIALTSHIGEAHTVNVDPKRPHIAYAVTSDGIGVSDDGKRENEDPNDSDSTDLDGFEVVDLRSCLVQPLGTIPPGTSALDKRQLCKPEVYRFRYPSAAIARGHTVNAPGQGVFGCHELELYPDDRLTCGSGNAGILFDVSGAFDDRGTPTDFTDDKPRGTPLPCALRDSTSTQPFQTGADVTDCVTGTRDGQAVDLRVPNWLAIGAPSLEGVKHLGSAHHMGRVATQNEATAPFDATEDIDFDHEAELTASRKFLLATDERGGGVVPPGASCTPVGDNEQGNGGLHAYAVDRLKTSLPKTAEEAFESYARTPDGKKAIFRAPIRTQPQGSFCTAHVFQQIPGQNRIFMAWYSQGTQVIDFIEHPDGSFEFKQAGFFIPENANEWVSHVFKVDQNPDGTFTYFGVTGDGIVGEGLGRDAIDVYRVTLPPPPQGAPRQTAFAGGEGVDCPVTGTAGNDTLDGGLGDDCIDGLGGRDRISGGSGEDRLAGSGGVDTLAGGPGEDVLFGGKDRDFMTGDGGDDTLEGGQGSNVVDGGQGDDTLRGGPRVDSLNGGADEDRIFGRGGDDGITGASGRDRLFGGDGEDRIDGGLGRDVISGGGGGDNIAATDGQRDRVRCGGGRDVVRADGGDRVARDCERVIRSNRGATGRKGTGGEPDRDPTAIIGQGGSRIPGTERSDCDLRGTDDNDVIDSVLGDDCLFGLAGLDILSGGSGDDRAEGGPDVDELDGGPGNDRLAGGAARDFGEGGPGRDRLDGEAGSNVLNGAQGNDILFGGDRADSLNGGSDEDRIEGGAGDDGITGASGRDRLFGQAGEDRIEGGLGKDVLSGGSGGDNIVATDGQRDVVVCGAGRDVVRADAGDAVDSDCERVILSNRR